MTEVIWSLGLCRALTRCIKEFELGHGKLKFGLPPLERINDLRVNLTRLPPMPFGFDMQLSLGAALTRRSSVVYGRKFLDKMDK